MKRVAPMIGIIMGCLFLGLLIAVAYIITFAEVSQSASATLRSGRSINATSHCWQGVDVSETSNDSASIDTAGYTIVVAPRQLIVAGQTFATVDEQAKSIDVDISHEEIAFKVDGKRVGSLLR